MGVVIEIPGFDECLYIAYGKALSSLRQQDSVMSRNTPSDLSFSSIGNRLRDPVIAKLMSDALSRPGLLSLAAGFTDNAALPEVEVADVVARMPGLFPGRQALQYGRNAGRPELRSEIVRHLASFPEEGELASRDPDEVIVTNGSQQALYMLMQLLCDPGDEVLVEAPSYFVFLEMLKGLGIQARSMPAGPDGAPDFVALAEDLDQRRAAGEPNRVRAVYFNGTYANASTRSWSEAEKRSLAAVLSSCDPPAVVIEDAAYRELYFDRPHPARSILSLPEFSRIPHVYCGTLTKPFATGLKIGYAITPHRLLRDGLLRVKGHQDFGSAHFNQAILEVVLREGIYHRHLERVRPYYRKKARVLEGALETGGLPGMGWTWRPAEGGLLLWASAPDGWDTRMDSRFCATCLREEVLYVPGDLCIAEGRPWNHVRLSFGSLDPERLEEAARRFVQAVRACHPSVSSI